MSVTASGGKMVGGRLRREVVMPVRPYGRLSSVIGLSLVLVLIVSAADALVLNYRAQQRFWRAEAAESMREALGGPRTEAARRLRQALGRAEADERAAQLVPPPQPDYLCGFGGP